MLSLAGRSRLPSPFWVTVPPLHRPHRRNDRIAEAELRRDPAEHRETLREQVAEQPEEAWASILQLVESSEEQELLEAIGAGPLEDILREHAETFVDRVEAESVANSRFKVAVCNVWLPNRRDPTTERLVTVGCQLIGEQS